LVELEAVLLTRAVAGYGSITDQNVLNELLVFLLR
jgi:hypothetical protein